MQQWDGLGDGCLGIDDLSGKFFQGVGVNFCEALGLCLFENEGLFAETHFNGLEGISQQVLPEGRVDDCGGHDSADFLVWINYIDHHFNFLHCMLQLFNHTFNVISLLYIYVRQNSIKLTIFKLILAP